LSSFSSQVQRHPYTPDLPPPATTGQAADQETLSLSQRILIHQATSAICHHHTSTTSAVHAMSVVSARHHPLPCQHLIISFCHVSSSIFQHFSPSNLNHIYLTLLLWIGFVLVAINITFLFKIKILLCNFFIFNFYLSIFFLIYFEHLIIFNNYKAYKK
jgi:hypothetical protein